MCRRTHLSILLGGQLDGWSKMACPQSSGRGRISGHLSGQWGVVFLPDAVERDGSSPALTCPTQTLTPTKRGKLNQTNPNPADMLSVTRFVSSDQVGKRSKIQAFVWGRRAPVPRRLHELVILFRWPANRAHPSSWRID
jgi:hypothetical protein